METQLKEIRQQQKQSWNRFSAGWKVWDDFNMKFLHPMGEAIIQQLDLKETDKVLDIAAGTGEPGLTIAAIVKNGSVVGTDLSEKMLEFAEGHAKERSLTNYTAVVADVCELPFAHASFDKISCRMGFMFFPDMQLAAAEMYRVLKPGGRLSTSVWGGPEQNFWVGSIMSVIKKHVDLPAPAPGAPGMFRCAKPGLIGDIFTAAGFKNVDETTIQGKADYGDTDTYWKNMMDVAAPVIAVLEKADDATKAIIKHDVYELVNAHRVNGRTALDFGARIISCEK
jgi:ubiquinone/menaquinone biosynthesis C-methylase UbiE